MSELLNIPFHSFLLLSLLVAIIEVDLEAIQNSRVRLLDHSKL